MASSETKYIYFAVGLVGGLVLMKFIPALKPKNVTIAAASNQNERGGY